MSGFLVYQNELLPLLRIRMSRQDVGLIARVCIANAERAIYMQITYKHTRELLQLSPF